MTTVTTKYPIIIDGARISPRDEYLAISGSDSPDMITAFQNWVNEQKGGRDTLFGGKKLLDTDGKWGYAERQAAKDYGTEFDQFWAAFQAASGAALTATTNIQSYRPAYTAEPSAEEQAEREKRGEFWDRARNTWVRAQESGVLDMLGGLFNRDRGNQAGRQYGYGYQMPTTQYPPVSTQPQETGMSRGTKTALIVGGVALVGLAAYLIISRK